MPAGQSEQRRADPVGIFDCLSLIISQNATTPLLVTVFMALTNIFEKLF